MAAVKNPAVSQAYATGNIAVGSGTTPGTVVNIATEDFADAYIVFLTGATAPTAAAVATLMVSVDNTTFYAAGALACSMQAATQNSGTLPIPASAQYARVDFSAPTGTAVSGGAQIGYGTF